MATGDKLVNLDSLKTAYDTSAKFTAPTEASSTASAAHATGEHFIYNGVLYVAKTDIASGATITPNTNCRAVPGGIGGEVSELKSAVDPFFTIDKNALIQGYYVAETDGERGTISSPYHYCTDFIYVKGLKSLITRTVFNYSCIGFYGAGKNTEKISKVTGTNNVLATYDVEIPANAYYVAISFYTYANTISTDNFSAIFETTINDLSLRINNLSDRLDDPLDGKADYVSQEMTTFIRDDLNSNRVHNSDIVEGSWISTSSGLMQTNQYTTGYSRTDYVPVSSGESYTWLQGNMPYSYAVYDENKTPISGYYGFAPQSGYVTIPQNGKYLGFCWDDKVGMSDYAVVIKGTTPISEYEPPYDKLLNDPYATRKYVDSLIPESDATPTLELPDQYEIVVGDKFQLFWKGVINAVEYLNYYPEVSCDIGKSYTRLFEYTGAQSDIGTHTMAVKLYDNGQNVLDEKTVNLVVKPKASSPSTEKVVLYVTDSLGDNGYVPDEFNRRLVGTGGNPAGDGLSNITFIGTDESTSRGIKYIGNGGWSWASYNSSMTTGDYIWVNVASTDKTTADQHSIYSDSNNGTWKLETIEETKIKIIRVSGSSQLPSSGQLTWVSGGENHFAIVYSSYEQAAGNPLWDSSQNKISFANFVSEQGETNLDYVYVLLGWNTTTLNETTFKNNVRTFLNNVLSDFPNCKIVILGIQIPSRDGLATNYGQNIGVLSSYRRSMNHVFNLNKWYSEVAAENDYASNVSFVNIAGQFDTEYNMPSTTVYVNTRNSTEIPRQYNGVHPAQSGYYQIADACYRNFVHKLQE